MFKNKEVSHLVAVELIFGIVGIISILMINLYMYNDYKKEIISNDAYIINSIIEKHPELEDEIIESMIDNNSNREDSLEIIRKYGLDDIDNLDYLNNNTAMRNKCFVISISFIIVLLITMFIVFFIFIKRTYKKINDLSKYTNNILNNKYTMDIREYNEGDISNLKNDLYKMTIKLKEQNELSLKDKKYLEDTLSDISHQLKTPLTSMYVINELLYDDEINKKTKKELLSKNKNQLERIEWLVSSLLKMSRLDSGSEVLKRKSTDIIKVIDKALAPLRIPLELKNIDVVVDCMDDIKANIDINWTVEALVNIIKNACEHTSENGKLEITCIDNPIYVGIDIKDNGGGITKEDMPHVFERFYKGQGSKESIGIGLNMAKKIIDMQSGDIKVVSKVGEGTTFKIKLFKNVI